MLIWRLILGFALTGIVAALSYFDFYSLTPGLWLSPLAIIGSFLGAGELVRLFESNAELYGATEGGAKRRNTPSRYVVATGAMITVLFSFAPVLRPPDEVVGVTGNLGWTAIGVCISLLIAIVVEMVGYKNPGVATVRLSQAVLAIAYSGGLMGCVVNLRLLRGEPWDLQGRWGLVALISLIAIVKGNDIGAYTAGRLFGHHKMTPILSPGKTWEGAAGGAAVGLLVGWACLGPLAEALGCVSSVDLGTRWLWGTLYSLALVAAAIGGDLAVSLMKRDAGLKNSSSWLPGFGGVLDLLDSIVFAAPIAYVFWIARAVGP